MKNVVQKGITKCRSSQIIREKGKSTVGPLRNTKRRVRDREGKKVGDGSTCNFGLKCPRSREVRSSTCHLDWLGAAPEKGGGWKLGLGSNRSKKTRRAIASRGLETPKIGNVMWGWVSVFCWEPKDPWSAGDWTGMEGDPYKIWANAASET